MELKVAIPDVLVEETKKTAPIAAFGAVVGAGTYVVIGGLGLAGLGGAIGITLLPMTCIGAGIATAGHRLYRWGQQSA